MDPQAADDFNIIPTKFFSWKQKLFLDSVYLGAIMGTFVAMD